jgi:5-methylthioadenosine/S-adenosylhomocysteine deaminase
MSSFVFSDSVLTHGAALGPKPMLIEMSGQHIVTVTPMSRASFDEHQFEPAAVVHDLGDALLTPTFINAHTHLSMSVFRGIETNAFDGNVVEDLYYRLETNLTPADVKAFARYAAYEALLSGTGLVWDHYYFAEALAEGLCEIGMPAVIAPTLQDIHGPGVSQLEAQLEATERLDSEQWRERGIFSALGPHATDTVSDDLWQTVGEISQRRSLPIHAHVSQSPEEYARMHLRHKMSPVEFLKSSGIVDLAIPKLLVHGLYVAQSDLELLVDRQAFLGYCPYSQVQFGFPARARQWCASGLDFAIGTDCGASNDSMDVQQELRLAASGYAFGLSDSSTIERFFEQPSVDLAEQLETNRVALRGAHLSHLTMSRLLDSVWTTPGQLHPKVACGQIAPGHLANLAVWDLNHPAFWPIGDAHRTLVMNHSAPALKGLFLMGQQRGRMGDFHRSILEETAYIESQKEAIERRDAFLKRLA